MDSLSRIDALLDRVSLEVKPAYDKFFNSQANVNVILVVAFYLGKTAATLSNARIDWYTYEQLQRLHPAIVTLERGWTTSLMCVLNKRPDGGGEWLFPLTAILSRMFSPNNTKSVRAAAEDLLKRAGT